MKLFEMGYTDFIKNLDLCRKYQTIEDMIHVLYDGEDD
jgi:hypothetical protein